MKAASLMALVLVLSGCATSSGLDRRTGVNLADDGRVQLHYALCAGEEMTVIRVEELVGGSRTEFGVPIYWQVESVGGGAARTVTVGDTPAGFVETVPLSRSLPSNDLLGIEGTRKDMGMSFRVDSLATDRILRGTYDSVGEEEFTQKARRECSQVRATGLVASFLIPIVLLGMVGALSRIRRSSLSWIVREVLTITTTFAAGSYIAVVVSGSRNYDLSPAIIATAVVLGGIGGVIAALIVSPLLFGGAALLGRVPPKRRAGYRVATLLALVGVGGLLLRRLDLPLVWWTITIGIGVSSVPLREAADSSRGPIVRRSVLVALVVLACVASIAHGWRSLDNSSEVVSPAARAAGRVNERPVAPPDGQALTSVGLNPRRSVSVRFTAPSEYSIRIECDLLGAQVSEGYTEPGVTHGRRRVLPCNGEPVEGSYADLPAGSVVHIEVSPNDGEGTLMVYPAE